MSVRRLYLDDAPGERRGVATLDGMPERLLIGRVTDRPEHQPGARLIARVRRVEQSLSSAFLDTGVEPDAILSLAGLTGVTEGAKLLIEIVAPPRHDKGAVARLIAPGEGEPRLIAPAPDLLARLQACAPGEAIERGPRARDVADAAEDAALAVEHPIPGGGRLFIEPTRALLAVDIDLGAAGGEARRAAAKANRAAIAATARLLRLKGLGGPVVIDLIGKGHDGAVLSEVARIAFAPDQPGVSIGPISRFGLMELVLPRRHAPVEEHLTDANGAATPLTLALRLLRQIERAAGPGLYIEGGCHPDAAVLARSLSSHLEARIGLRFVITAKSDAPWGWIGVAPIERLP